MANVYLKSLVQIRPTYLDLNNNKTHLHVWWAFGNAGDGPYTLPQLQAVQAAVDAAFTSDWPAAGGAAGKYTSCYVIDWSSNTGLEVAPNSSISVAGTGTDTTPSNVAGLVSGENGFRYRGGRPRIYFPLVTYTPGTPDVPGSGATSGINSLVTAVNTNLFGVSSADGGPFEWGNYRYRDDAAKAAFTGVTWKPMELLWATQRRRIRKAPHH